MRFQPFRLFLLLALCLPAPPAAARRGQQKSFLTLAALYSSYKDLSLGRETSERKLEEGLDVELGIRIFRSFSFLAVGTTTEDRSRQGYGAGVRIDLPGVFFFGAGERMPAAKNYPVNTSAYFHSLLTETDNGTVQKRTVASRYGLSLEIFLFNPAVYLVLDGSIYNLEGNAFATSAIGLGAEF